MKKLIVILTALIVVVSSGNLFAQPQQQQHPQQPPRREVGDGGFTEFQIQLLTKQLRLEEKKASQFEALYKEYTQKMKDLQPEPQKRPAKGEQPAKPTNAEIESQILESFTQAEKTTALKKEYYYKFKKILTPDQILKMYNTERRIRDRIVSESSNRSEKN
ncbi:MAG: hypothetical protein SNG02_04750 [Rikenellaceae bacterium]